MMGGEILLTLRSQLHERLQKEGVKTHKQRVEELNKYLSNLSEHHDMYVPLFPLYVLVSFSSRHANVFYAGQESDLDKMGLLLQDWKASAAIGTGLLGRLLGVGVVQDASIIWKPNPL